jgi:hypothetical protein
MPLRSCANCLTVSTETGVPYLPAPDNLPTLTVFLPIPNIFIHIAEALLMNRPGVAP